MPSGGYERLVGLFQDAGWALTTPCAIICAASQPDQQVWRATLAGLAHSTPLPAPALLIVGEVAAGATPSAECAPSLELQNYLINQ